MQTSHKLPLLLLLLLPPPSLNQVGVFELLFFSNYYYGEFVSLNFKYELGYNFFFMNRSQSKKIKSFAIAVFFVLFLFWGVSFFFFWGVRK